MITERQKILLNKIVEGYIKSAQPVSSLSLEKECDLKICPATIRNDMKGLSDAGLICQPHTSAGRIPTDQGYRFFVNDLLNKQLGNTNEIGLMKEIDACENAIKLLQHITRSVADFSSSLVMGYLSNEKILFKEGWEDVIQEPEFKEHDFAANFAGFIKDFEDEIGSLNIHSSIEIYIGEENPFSKAGDFSIMLSKCRFPDKEEGILGIVGPKRMAYKENIKLMNSLIKLLDNF